MRLQFFTAGLRIGACGLIFMLSGCGKSSVPAATVPAQPPP